MGHSSNEELRQNLSGERCVYVCVCDSVYEKECRLADEVCVCTEAVCLCMLVCACLRGCAHARTKLGVTMDSKGAFEVF